METIERLITGSKTNFSTKVEHEIIGNDSLVLSLPTIEGRERRLTKNDKIGIVKINDPPDESSNLLVGIRFLINLVNYLLYLGSLIYYIYKEYN